MEKTDEYRHRIIRQQQKGVNGMINNLPSPQMFGGAMSSGGQLSGGTRVRQFALPTPMASNYPSSLAVAGVPRNAQISSGSGRRKKCNGGDMNTDSKDYGSLLGTDPSTYSPEGGSIFSSLLSGAKSFGKFLAPHALDLAKNVGTNVVLPAVKDKALDLAKQAFSNHQEGGKRPTKRQLQLIANSYDKLHGGDFFGDLANGVSQAVQFIAPFAPLLLGLGHEATGCGISVNDELDLAKQALGNHLQGSGRKPPKKQLQVIADAYDKLHGGDFFGDFAKGVGDAVNFIAPFAPLLLGLGHKKGGMILSKPNYAQHESNTGVYPKGLESYNRTFAHSLEGGKVKSKRPSARGKIVAEVMKKQGLNLAQASKFVKEHNLY